MLVRTFLGVTTLNYFFKLYQPCKAVMKDWPKHKGQMKPVILGFEQVLKKQSNQANSIFYIPKQLPLAKA